MKKHRLNLYAIGLAMAISVSAAFLSLPASADDEAPLPVSPALSVIAEDNGMAMAGLIGTSIEFESDDFARALNLAEVGAITITEAPAVSEGELRLGNTVLTSGQTVSARNISLMSYTASTPQATTATFRFSHGDVGYDIPCRVYLLSEPNASPTLGNVPETYLNVSTHRNVTLYGSLPCHDPDGDKTIIEIVSYPEEGLLHLTDKYSGEYTYTPSAGYSGKDSFVYVARDIYGNYSASARVSLTVNKPSLSVSFEDMKSSPYYNAALTMAEEGIMSGTKVGSDVYFYPDSAVSRGEFLVMAMHTLGVSDISTVTSTDFADDADIPQHMKGYVATAKSLGYIDGVSTEKGVFFEADRSITRAEAAVMLGNMLDLSTPTTIPVFKDSESIPSWASPSLYSLSSIGVMNAVDGNISPLCALTRADAAQILANLLNYVD